MINLCLTLAEPSFAALNQKIAQYTGQVPYIEVRLDYLAEPQVPTVQPDQGTDFIATCRPSRVGGRYRGEEQDRLDRLQKAALHELWPISDPDLFLGSHFRRQRN